MDHFSELAKKLPYFVFRCIALTLNTLSRIFLLISSTDRLSDMLTLITVTYTEYRWRQHADCGSADRTWTARLREQVARLISNNRLHDTDLQAGTNY